MGIKSTLTSLLLAIPLGLAHPAPEKIYQHNAVPREARSLDHCKREFSHPEFVKKTTEIHGAELQRLRRALGYEPHDRYAVWDQFALLITAVC
jgi:hypothetical protein